jgi:hypothetical protein
LQKTRKKMIALMLLVPTIVRASPLLLTEAGGTPSAAAAGRAKWGWQAVSPPSSKLCNDSLGAAAVLIRSSSLAIIRGPSPHVTHELSHKELEPAWTFAAVSENWLILTRPKVPDVLAVKFTPGCSSIASVQRSVSPFANATSPYSWLAISSAADSKAATTTTLGIVADTNAEARLARLTLAPSSGQASASLSDHALPRLSMGCNWSVLAQMPRSRAFAAAACPPKSTSINTYVLTMGGVVLAAAAAYLPGGGSDWVGGGWATWQGGGGLAGGLLIGRNGSTTLPRALPMDLEPPDYVLRRVGDLTGVRRTERTGAGTGSAAQRLVARAPFALDDGRSDTERQWAAVAFGAWFTPEPSQVGKRARDAEHEAQLIAARHYPDGRGAGANGRGNTDAEPHAAEEEGEDEFVVSTLVYASPSRVEGRMLAVSGVLGQQGLTSVLNTSAAPGELNTSLLREYYRATHTNTHNFEVCSADHYEAFVQLLHDTARFTVDGRQLRLWMEILPPTESIKDGCSPPPDSSLTPFNETAAFMSVGNSSMRYLNYEGWGEIVGRLGALFPHLVALQMDDFTHDVYSPPYAIFRPPLLARMTSRMRSHAPRMAFLPVVYYSEGKESVLERWPDLILTMDAPLYYFRNQRQGAGPCAAAECTPFWGPATRPPTNASRSGGCLAGPCAVLSVPNVQEEVRIAAAYLPAGRKLLVGFYATGHSHLGTPTPDYVRALPQLAMAAHPDVVGIMSFTMLAPCGPRRDPGDGSCQGDGGRPSWIIDTCAKGCAISDAYAELAKSQTTFEGH